MSTRLCRTSEFQALQSSFLIALFWHLAIDTNCTIGFNCYYLIMRCRLRREGVAKMIENKLASGIKNVRWYEIWTGGDYALVSGKSYARITRDGKVVRVIERDKNVVHIKAFIRSL